MFETTKVYHKWLFDELPYVGDEKYQKRQVDMIPTWYLVFLIYDLLFGWWRKEL